MSQKEKHPHHDFEPSGLPTKRWQQFGDIVKIRWQTLLFMGLILFAFSLPLLLVIVAKDFRALSIQQNASDETARQSQLFLNQAFFGLLYFPAVFLVFFALSGLNRIYRNLIWGEGVYFWVDFKIGVKQNLIQYTALSLLLTLAYYLSVVTAYVVAIPFLFLLPLALLLVFFFPVGLIHMELISVYKNNFFKGIMNAFRLLTHEPLRYYGIYALLLLPLVALHLLEWPFLAKYIVFAVSFLFYMPFALLAWALMNQYAFDKYINHEIHPELYKKGLNSLESDNHKE